MIHRVQSWQNYAALFTALIEDEDGSKVCGVVMCLGKDEMAAHPHHYPHS